VIAAWVTVGLGVVLVTLALLTGSLALLYGSMAAAALSLVLLGVVVLRYSRTADPGSPPADRAPPGSS
jgi:hypothetical protein